MNKSFDAECIKFSGAKVCEDNRKTLFKVFTTFGSLKKLYINPTNNFGYVHFEDVSKYNQLVEQLNEIKPLNLSFTLHSRKDLNNSYSSKGVNNSSTISSSCDSESNISEDMVEIDASVDEYIYCIHGHKIPQFSDNSNNWFIPLNAIKCLNLKFYNSPPNKDKLEYNQEMINEFKIYMKQKALSFMHRNKVKIDDLIVQNSIGDCKELIFENSKTNGFSPPQKNIKRDELELRKPITCNDKYKQKTPPKKRFSTSTVNNHTNEPKSNNSIVKKSPNVAKSVIEPLKYIELNIGVTYEVLVTHVDDDGFYVQLQERKQDIDNLMFRAVKESGLAKPVTAVTGNVCFALFLGVWYRAIVLTTTPTVKVRYIDYGNTNTDVIKEVRQMNKDLSAIPAEAVKIQLDKPTIIKDDTVLNLKLIKKTGDGSYMATLIDEEKSSATEQPATSKEIKIPSKKCVIDIPSRSSATEQPALSKEIKMPSRKCVIDIPSRTALLTFIRMKSSCSFFAFIYHENCMEGISTLDDISEESATDFNYRPTIGTTIAVKKEDDNSWVRGVVLKTENNKYTCALIDYGIIQETDQICKLDAKYETIMEYSCIIDFKEEFRNLIEEAQENIRCEILKERKLIIYINDKSIPAVASKWDPFENNTIITTLPAKSQLKNGDTVRISHVKDGKFYIQSRECFDLLKALNNNLTLHKGLALSRKPILNEMVLHQCLGKKMLCRAVVKNISNKTVDLYYIDYGLTHTIGVEELFEYDEKYNKFNITLSTVELNNFKVNDYTPEIIEEINKIKAIEKFTVIITDQPSKVELKIISNEMPLSEHLKNIGNSNVIMIKDIPKHEIKNGDHKLLCLYNADLNRGLIAFCAPNVSADAVEELNESINKCTSHPHEPYAPVVNEVCLALFDDSWYRAIVQKSFSTKYEVYFIDYGNFGQVNSNEIRPIPKELIILPPVAILCEIDGLVENILKDPKICTKVMELCEETTQQDVEILKLKPDGRYLIKILLLDEIMF